jgi:hypothetical protein
VPNVGGRWAMSFTLADEVGTTVCSGGGTIDIAQSGGGLAGTFERTGRCTTPGGPVDLAHRFELADAAVTADRLAFLAGCTFDAVLAGTPPDSAAGDVFCGPGAAVPVALRGTWTMQR